MNSLTLNFKLSNLEKDFRSSKQCFYSIILEHQKWIFGMINIISIVSSLVSKDWVAGSLNVCTLIFIMISIKFKQKYPIIYEVVIIIFLLIYNTYLAMEKYLNQIETHYVEGFFISLSCVSALAPLSFIERTAMTILIIALHLIFGIDHNTIFVGSYFKYLMYALFFLQFTYHFEKLMRIQFIECKKLQQQLQKITKFHDILSYSIKYDERKSLILIQKNNKTNIKKEDQDEFNKLASSMYLSIKSTKNRITEVINMDQAFSPNRQTLKQLLLNLTVENQNDHIDRVKSINIQNYTPQRNRNDYILYGFYKQQVYTLCVYFCLDIQPTIAILMKESKSETQEEELKLRMRNNQKQFNYLSKIFDQQIKKSLIYFKWIQNYANKQADIKVINSLLRTINHCLVKGYTDFLNLENFNQIYTIQPKLKQFDIQLLLKDIIAVQILWQISSFLKQKIIQAITQFYSKQRYLIYNFYCELVIITQDYQQHNFQLNCLKSTLSDFKYVKLLFLNLLFYTSQASQTIVIELEEVQSKLLQQPIIKVKIIYQHPNKSKQQLQNLPILNPQSLTDLKHNSQVPLELDLAVSLMLIRRLGPFDKLKIIQQKRRSNYLEFYLFKQLTEDFLLMPIISLKPVDKIITQQDSLIMNSFSTELRLDSIQNSIQFL